MSPKARPAAEPKTDRCRKCKTQWSYAWEYSEKGQGPLCGPCASIEQEADDVEIVDSNGRVKPATEWFCDSCKTASPNDQPDAETYEVGDRPCALCEGGTAYIRVKPADAVDARFDEERAVDRAVEKAKKPSKPKPVKAPKPTPKTRRCERCGDVETVHDYERNQGARECAQCHGDAREAWELAAKTLDGVSPAAMADPAMATKMAIGVRVLAQALYEQRKSFREDTAATMVVERGES